MVYLQYSQLNESLAKSQDDMAHHVAGDSEKINNLTTQVDDIQNDVATSLTKLENSLLDRIDNLTGAIGKEQVCKRLVRFLNAKAPYGVWFILWYLIYIHVFTS